MGTSLFVPEGAFEVLIRQQIARLLEPALDCSNLVYEELRRLVLSIKLPELQRYYKLQSRMHDVMEGVLNECLTPTNDMILNLIEIETSLINTNHPDFIGSADAMLNLFQAQDEAKSEGSENENQAELNLNVNNKKYTLMSVGDKPSE
jgi:dynamin 1-like protein